MLVLVFSSKIADKLSPNEEFKLFVIIRDSNDLKKVEKDFSKFYNAVALKLWGFLYEKFKGNIPPKTIQDLEDSYQNGWKRIIEKRKQFKPESEKSAFNWLLTLLINNTYNDFSIRKQDKYLKENTESHLIDGRDEAKEYQIQSLDDGILDITDESYSAKPEAIAHSNMVLKMIDKGVDSELTDIEKIIFEMSVKKDIKYDEISEKLGVSIKTVYKHLNSACDKMRAYLKQNNISWETL